MMMMMMIIIIIITTYKPSSVTVKLKQSKPITGLDRP